MILSHRSFLAIITLVALVQCSLHTFVAILVTLILRSFHAVTTLVALAKCLIQALVAVAFGLSSLQAKLAPLI